jgi:hypothetical protein
MPEMAPIPNPTEQVATHFHSAPPAELPPQRPWWKDRIFVMSAAVPSTILAVYFVHLYRQHETKELFRQVYALKLEVDDLMKSNQPRAALNKCEEMLDMIGDPTTADPKMQGYAEIAKNTSEQLREEIHALFKQEEAVHRAESERKQRGVPSGLEPVSNE